MSACFLIKLNEPLLMESVLPLLQAVTVEQRDNFHVFYMQIGSHVNQDTELGDVYYSPGLAGVCSFPCSRVLNLHA
jgi:hypothetical protein